MAGISNFEDFNREFNQAGRVPGLSILSGAARLVSFTVGLVAAAVIQAFATIFLPFAVLGALSCNENSWTFLAHYFFDPLIVGGMAMITIANAVLDISQVRALCQC